LAILIYIALFSFFTIMRHLSSKLGDPDASIFSQSFYTALKYGMPFNNAFEAMSRFEVCHLPQGISYFGIYNTPNGISHFGIHYSPIFYLLLPFYWIHSSYVTLLILQTSALAIGAYPVFLIAKDRLGEKIALAFSILYLLYHPLHGVNYDQFNELSFAVAPLLFALYFFMKRKFAPFWCFLILTLMCKEDAAFVVIFFGIYGIITYFLEKKRDKILLWNSTGIFMFSVIYLYLSLYIIIPHFHPSGGFVLFSERFKHLGNSLSEVGLNLIIHPQNIFKYIFIKENVFYFFELFLPLAFLPFVSPGLLFMTIPVFFITMISRPLMCNTGGRYSAYLIPFIFGAAVFAFEKIMELKKDKEKSQRKLIITMLTLTILCTLFLSNTPARMGFKVPKITEHQKKILAIAKTIPKEASISTQADILQHVCQRLHAYSGYRIGTDYIFVDEASQWYKEQACWDKVMPSILAENRYEKIYEDDGIKIYKKKK